VERILEEMSRVHGSGTGCTPSRAGGKGVVVEAAHDVERYDAAVVTVPIWAAGELLGAAVPEAAALVPSTEAELVIRRDGTFRRGDRTDSEVSIRTLSDAAQLTTTAGRLSGREVLRSRVTYAPGPLLDDVLARVRYRHPIPLPAARRAQEMVRALDRTDSISPAHGLDRLMDSRRGLPRERGRERSRNRPPPSRGRAPSPSPPVCARPRLASAITCRTELGPSASSLARGGRARPLGQPGERWSPPVSQAAERRGLRAVPRARGPRSV
jgi:hypothetical protein